MKISFNQMDRKMFKENLLKTIKEILEHNKIQSCSEIRFTLTVDKELDKKHNSQDDTKRLGTLLGTLYGEDINNQKFNLDEIIKMLYHSDRHYPLWVNVSLEENKEDYLIFKLRSSSRFRRPSELLNKDTNHPPFKADFGFSAKK